MSAMTPEQIVAVWRQENIDDEANHDFEGDVDKPGEKCTTCGDDVAGLLHAFDPGLPQGFHDEAIYEVVSQAEAEAPAEHRSYVVGLPVVVYVEPDGSVRYEVDLSEASEIEVIQDEDESDEEFAERAKQADLDVELIEKAVTAYYRGIEPKPIHTIG